MTIDIRSYDSVTGDIDLDKDNQGKHGQWGYIGHYDCDCEFFMTGDFIKKMAEFNAFHLLVTLGN